MVRVARLLERKRRRDGKAQKREEDESERGRKR